MTAAAAPEHPKAAWLWLVDRPRAEDALVVGPDAGGLAAELAGHFTRVVTAPTLTAFPHPAGAFDCVQMTNWATVLESTDGGAGIDDLLAECRRLLRPGGHLSVAVDNPWWYGRLRRGPGTALSQRMHVAGFRKVRRFFEHPSHHNPRCLIPDSTLATVAYETHHGASGAVGVARRLVAWCGAHRLLYRSIRYVSLA